MNPSHTSEGRRVNILVVGADRPTPATHGGRLDLRNMLHTFRAWGHSVDGIFWTKATDHTPGSDDDRLGTGTLLLHRQGRVASSLARPGLPLQVATRRPTGSVRRQCKEFVTGQSYDALVVSQTYNSALLPYVLDLVDLPFILREHNDEAAYSSVLAAASMGLSRLVYMADAWRFPRSEAIRNAVQHARAIWSISESVILGRDAIVTGPFCVSYPPLTRVRVRQPQLLYVGNLYMPNNIAEIDWFLREVWPTVLAKMPSATVTIAGRDPSPKAARRWTTAPAVSVVPSPRSLDQLYGGASGVLVPTLAGAGVSMKMVDALARGAAIAATSTGIRGLPRPVPCLLADDAKDYADCCIKLLRDEPATKRLGERAREYSLSTLASTSRNDLRRALEELASH